MARPSVKAGKIEVFFKRRPAYTDKEIAQRVGCSPNYVYKLRSIYEATPAAEIKAAAMCEHGYGSQEYCHVCEVKRTPPEPDMVNHPPHYTDGGIEAIEYIAAKLTEEEFIGYVKGNVLKYVSRAGKKGDLFEDFEKAKFYLDLVLV